jgi:hypothetical protein
MRRACRCGLQCDDRSADRRAKHLVLAVARSEHRVTFRAASISASYSYISRFAVFKYPGR